MRMPMTLPGITRVVGGIAGAKNLVEMPSGVLPRALASEACRAGVICSLLLWLGMAGLAHAQATTATIALTGQGAPGTGAGTFSYLFSGPVLNDAGTIAFYSNVTGGSSPHGIFKSSGGSIINIVLEGQAAPGTSGTLFGFATPPGLDASGTVLLNAGISADPVAQKGIFKGAGGSLTPLELWGQTAPGTGGGTFKGSLLSAVNDGGSAVIQAGVSGGTTTEGIFKASGGSLTNIAVLGQVAPGTGGGTFVAFNVPELNAAGTVAFSGGITGGTVSSGVFSGSGGSLTPIALAGQPAPGTGGGTILTLQFCALNDNGTAAFVAGVSGGTSSSGIFSGSGGPLTTIAVQGQTAPGTGGGGFLNLRTPALNENGTVVFRADISAGTSLSGIFKGNGGSLTQIAVQGQAAPGTGGGTFSAFNDPAIINTNGTTAFLANIAGGTGNQGIFLADGSSIIPVAAVGQPLAGSTIMFLSFVDGGPSFGPDSGGRSGLNEFGQVTYAAYLANGSSGIFRFSPDDPLTSTSGGGAIRNTRFVGGMSYSKFTATTDPGNLGTTVSLLGGTVGSGGAGTLGLNRDVNITFVPPNPILPASDIVTLTGTEGDTFVLQLSYNEALVNSLFGSEANARLGWLNAGQWVLAVAGNTGGTSSFVTGAWNASYPLGSYGVDLSTNTVWAVLNHNSEFAVVPVHLAGDVDGDGHVDVTDLLWLVDAFGSMTGDSNYDPRCDFNGDGSVDVSDLLDMVYNFGK
jgi:hypothetical protein